MINHRIGNYVIVRREFARDSFGIWFCDRYKDSKIKIAKPVQLEWEEQDDGFLLPEPTLYLPGPATREFFESFSNSLEYAGERFLEARSTIKAQDANLADLRKYLDRAFGIMEQK